MASYYIHADLSSGSTIEWTEATWNPTTGCTKISPGCKNCYAERLSKRLKAMGVKKYKNNFKFTEQPDDLELPFTWKKSKRIFVNSMSDLFHEKSRMEYVGNCFYVMLQADHHHYQVLTKRSGKMLEFSKIFKKYFGHKIPPHVWMGVSIENEDFKWRVNDLRRVRCHTRFLSIEPLLGPVGKLNLRGIDWVIIGGESGYGHRPIRRQWVADIIRQCKKQKVAVFFKQWGGNRPKSGGRTINGRTYDEYPQITIEKSLKEFAYNEKEFERFCRNTVLEKRQKTAIPQI